MIEDEAADLQGLGGVADPVSDRLACLLQKRRDIVGLNILQHHLQELFSVGRRHAEGEIFSKRGVVLREEFGHLTLERRRDVRILAKLGLQLGLQPRGVILRLIRQVLLPEFIRLDLQQRPLCAGQLRQEGPELRQRTKIIWKKKL